MLRLYSKETGSTYIKGFNTKIPEDAVEITEDNYEAVIANPEPGKVRSHDKNGLPILIDPLPATGEELAAIERTWRDLEIERVKWIRERHRDESDMGKPASITAAQFSELLIYIQRLRDWPESPAFPAKEDRPVIPGWIADLVP